MYYPLFIDIRQMRCVVIGAGVVGLRKAQGLIQAAAHEVLVIDTQEFSAQWTHLQAAAAEKGCTVLLEQEAFAKHHLEGARLVFACTGIREVNAEITKLCVEQGIFCNCVDAPLEGNCIVPALAKAREKTANHTNTHEYFPLTAAISTGGASPAWSRVLRTELEEWLQPHAPMTILLGRLRPLVLALDYDTRHNTELFRSLVHSPLRQLLLTHERQSCIALLETLLPKVLHKHITELLHDII